MIKDWKYSTSRNCNRNGSGSFSFTPVRRWRTSKAWIVSLYCFNLGASPAWKRLERKTFPNIEKNMHKFLCNRFTVCCFVLWRVIQVQSELKCHSEQNCDIWKLWEVSQQVVILSLLSCVNRPRVVLRSLATALKLLNATNSVEELSSLVDFPDCRLIHQNELFW